MGCCRRTASLQNFLSQCRGRRDSQRCEDQQLHPRNQPVFRPHSRRMGSCFSGWISEDGACQEHPGKGNFVRGEGPASQCGLEGGGGDQRGEEPGPVRVVLGLWCHRADRGLHCHRFGKPCRALSSTGHLLCTKHSQLWWKRPLSSGELAIIFPPRSTTPS